MGNDDNDRREGARRDYMYLSDMEMFVAWIFLDSHLINPSPIIHLPAHQLLRRRVAALHPAAGGPTFRLWTSVGRILPPPLIVPGQTPPAAPLRVVEFLELMESVAQDFLDEVYICVYVCGVISLI